MEDTFWDRDTPTVADADRSSAYLPIRVAGSGGASDKFAQLPLSQFPLATTPEFYGAIPGVIFADNTAALNAFFAVAASAIPMNLPGKTYYYQGQLFIPQGDDIDISGRGTLVYNGSATTLTMLTVGSTTRQSVRMRLSGLRLTSLTTMTDGWAVKLNKVYRSTILDLFIDGQDGNGNLYNGIWYNGCDVEYLERAQISCAGTALRCNDGSDLFLDMVKISPADQVIGTSRNTKIGIHQAGGMGGVQMGDIDVVGCNDSYHLDNTISSAPNREMTFSSLASLDSAATGVNLYLNETSGAPIYVGSNGWFASAQTHNIQIVNSSSEYHLVFAGGRIYNSKTGDGLLNDAPNARISLCGTEILNNGRYGVENLHPDTAIVAVPGCPMQGNVLGDTLGVRPDAFADIQQAVANFAANTGGDLVGFSRVMTATSGRGAARIVTSKAQDRFDFRDMPGADITGANDMASTLTAALAESSASEPLHIPRGVIMLGSTVSAYSGAHMIGRGVQMYGDAGPYTSGTTRGAGSWFRKVHNGVGIAVTGGIYPSNVKLDGIGFFEDQPTPASGWTPNLSSDFMVTTAGARLIMRDVGFLNPTRAFRQLSGYGGHIQCNNVFGQPMLIGGQIDDGYEGFTTGGPVGIRWWPFWSDDAYTRSFTLANRRGLYLRHIDNPTIAGFFDFASAYPLYIGSHPNGVVNNCTLIHPEFDNYGISAVYFEAGSDGSYVKQIGGYAYGLNGGDDAVPMLSNNATYVLSAPRFQQSQKSIIRMGSGTGNTAYLTSPDVGDWNVSGSSAAAFVASSGNRIFINGDVIKGAGNGAPLVNDQNLVSSNAPITTAPAVTAASGTLTSASCSLTTTRRGAWVDVQMMITVTTNGTGAGALLVTLPVPVRSSFIGSLSGSLATGTGGGVTGRISGSVCQIQTDANTYPAANGSIITLSGRYLVADL